MIIAPLEEISRPSDPFIYAACDSEYFDEFGQEFVNSIHQHTAFKIHIHLFNPTRDQLDFCNNHKVSVTHEQVPIEWFQTSLADKLDSKHLERTHTAMKKGDDQTIAERLRKTYYACVRFVRLSEIFQGTTTAFSADIDAIVRADIPALDTTHDFYIHQITGKKARFLAGGLWLNPTDGSVTFLHDYADQLKQSIKKDYIYWGLDQDVLDPIMSKYNYGQLPMKYIDWDMNDNSYVWTAKGERKKLSLFKTEKNKYKD
jgi:hypothetical protein